MICLFERSFLLQLSFAPMKHCDLFKKELKLIIEEQMEVKALESQVKA